MKKTIAILLISLMLFTSGCAVMTAAAPEPTPAPPTVEELLADALKYYNAGNYEEAILLYEAAIEIEPRNLDATVGLGKTYRSTGNNGQAVEMLKAAYELNDSPDVAFELGCAYIANGQYTDAERLASERWKDCEGDNKAGTVLLLSLAAQEKTEEVIKMLQREDFTLFLGTGGGNGPLYMGEYDANGKRSGRGIGIYEGGYIYAGEYKDGVRCGQGTWYYLPNPYVHETTWFTGEWADDAPNGKGTICMYRDMPAEQQPGVTYTHLSYYECDFENGISKGTCQTTWYMYGGDIHYWSFSVEQGKNGNEVLAECSDCGARLMGPTEVNVSPWGRLEG